MSSIQKNENVVSKTVQSEEILLNLDTGIYFGLNEIGTLLWNRIKQGATTEELHSLLVDQYDINQDQAVSDVDDLLGVLRANHLIQ